MMMISSLSYLVGSSAPLPSMPSSPITIIVAIEEVDSAPPSTLIETILTSGQGGMARDALTPRLLQCLTAVQQHQACDDIPLQ